LSPLFCNAQKNGNDYQGDLDYKKIIEIDGLIYLKADTTLVTGRVVSYNKKKEAKRYVEVVNGKPNNLGWIYINKNTTLPEESGLGEVLLYGAALTGVVIEAANGSLFNPIPNNSNISRAFGNKDYTLKTYNEMLERDEISKNLYSINTKSDEDFEEYDENSNLIINGNFNKEKKDGLWEEYFDNGQLRSSGNYIRGKKDGLWQEYYENGNLANRVNFKEGKKVGLLKNYYSDGQLKGRINYKEGKEHGMMELYHQNGKLMLEGFFKEANQISVWKYYDEDGKLINIETFDK